MSYTLAASAPRSDEPVTARTLLVGNPNVGKSVLFGLLTGRYAQVANYPDPGRSRLVQLLEWCLQPLPWFFKTMHSILTKVYGRTSLWDAHAGCRR